MASGSGGSKVRLAVRRWLVVLLAGLAVALPAAASVIVVSDLDALDESGVQLVLPFSPVLVTSGILRMTTGVLDIDHLYFFSGDPRRLEEPVPVMEVFALDSGVRGASLDAASVPEPEALLLLAAGLAGLRWVRRRR
jgi:hypothetical protein